jgi:serine phosphatase RsbU (regulator of sigma subunit)/anti-sigma regulatory factor (Ser/Thr protein kinase)
MTGEGARNEQSAEARSLVLQEAVVEATSRLNGARTAQEIADAVGEVVRDAAGWFGVALGLTDPVESVLQQYWCAPLRDSISARYVRIPLALDTPQTRAIRTAAPVFILDAAMLQAEFPGPFRQARTEGLGPCAAFPLSSSTGEVIGSLALMWTTDFSFGPTERVFAVEIAAVTEQAVDRVQAAAREASVADALQSAFLSLDVHSPAVVVDAVYRSADTDLQIGGDWYDAIERADGRVFVTVGDTVGSGLDATAAMGRLRSSSGVTALQTPDPARVLEYLDDYAGHVPGATAATVAIAVYEPRRHRLKYVCAGHPPPIVVRPTGAVELLWGARSWPLDLDLGRDRPPPATASFPPGSLLLLYTDGLVERRGESIDRGLERLVESLRRNWTLPIPVLLGAVLADCGVQDGTAHDDTALIALRSVGASDVHYVDVISAEREQLSLARSRLHRWLERIGTDADFREGVVVAANEVIANALEHGSDFDAGKLVTVQGSAAGPSLVLSVRDTGRWRPGIEEERPDRGRGFVLVEELTDQVRIDRDPNGTTVTLVWSR